MVFNMLFRHDYLSPNLWDIFRSPITKKILSPNETSTSVGEKREIKLQTNYIQWVTKRIHLNDFLKLDQVHDH